MTDSFVRFPSPEQSSAPWYHNPGTSTHHFIRQQEWFMLFLEAIAAMQKLSESLTQRTYIIHSKV